MAQLLIIIEARIKLGHVTQKVKYLTSVAQFRIIDAKFNLILIVAPTKYLRITSSRDSLKDWKYNFF